MLHALVDTLDGPRILCAGRTEPPLRDTAGTAANVVATLIAAE